MSREAESQFEEGGSQPAHPAGSPLGTRFLGCARNTPARALYSRHRYLASEKETSTLH